MSDFPIDLAARRQIALALLGPIDEKGFCRCPGVALHTNKSAVRRVPERPGRDCRVFLERPAPTVFCVHTSCQSEVAEMNHRLRSEVGKHEAAAAKGERCAPVASPTTTRRSKEEIAAERENLRKRALATRAQNALPLILKDWAWDRADMWADSADIPESPLEQARAVLRLFPAGDVVWCGEFKDSIARDLLEEVHPGRLARVARCFRPVEEWLDERAVPGPRVCPSAFKAGSHSRGTDEVAARRFVVIEHDNMAMEEQAAVLRWLSHAGYHLRAVVFTGGKSLHGWFDCPTGEELTQMETVLGALGYDPASFRPAQPYRLPGWKHDKTGKLAELWFLGGRP